MSSFSVNWRLMGLLTVATLVFASLFLPQRLEEMRTGYWAVEHFLAYFVATFVVFRGWRRPLAVAGTLVFLGLLLEALQCLEVDHDPNIFAALSSVGGVFVQQQSEPDDARAHARGEELTFHDRLHD